MGHNLRQHKDRDTIPEAHTSMNYGSEESSMMVPVTIVFVVERH